MSERVDRIRIIAALILLDRCKVNPALLSPDFRNVKISNEFNHDASCVAVSTNISVGNCFCKLIGQVYVNYNCTIPVEPPPPIEETVN